MPYQETKSPDLKLESVQPTQDLSPLLSWRERKEWFSSNRKAIVPSYLPVEEVQAHFDHMPSHYWEKVSAEDLSWGLEVIHRFFHDLAQPAGGGAGVMIDWRETSEKGVFTVVFSTWDRQGLLAKAAAVFSAVGFSILQAEAYTRSDHVVLDMFRVFESAPRPGGRWKEISFLLEGALSQPPRFASVWACSRHRHLAEPSQIPLTILIENPVGQDWTSIRIEASDRLGLLYDVLQEIADADLHLHEAEIRTEVGKVKDTLLVTNRDGNKLADAKQINDLRQRLENALTING